MWLIILADLAAVVGKISYISDAGAKPAWSAPNAETIMATVIHLAPVLPTSSIHHPREVIWPLVAIDGAVDFDAFHTATKPCICLDPSLYVHLSMIQSLSGQPLSQGDRPKPNGR